MKQKCGIKTSLEQYAHATTLPVHIEPSSCSPAHPFSASVYITELDQRYVHSCFLFNCHVSPFSFYLYIFCFLRISKYSDKGEQRKEGG